MNRRLLAAIAAVVVTVGLVLTAGHGSGAVPFAVRPPLAHELLRSARAQISVGSALEPTLGEVFTATPGTWTHSPTSFTYQWQRCGEAGGSCANIVGATTNKYTVVSADELHKLRVGVIATNTVGSSTVVFSAETGLVPGAGSLVPTAPPKIAPSEVTQGGTALSLASTGTWTEAPTTISYQWERCLVSAPNAEVEPACIPEVGATSSTYTPQSSDAGYSLRCKVGGKTAGTSFGFAMTGYTVGVEPKYGRLYAAGNFWNQKLPTSGTQLMTEQERYAKGFEQAWAKDEPTIQNEANSVAFQWVPQAEPTTPVEYTAAVNFKEELANGLSEAPVSPWAVGATGGTSGGGTPDKHMMIWEAASGGEHAREFDLFSVSAVSSPGVQGYQLTSETPVNTTEIKLTGAEAKGFVKGARIFWNRTEAGITRPRESGTIYYVISSSETGFTFSNVPANLGGTALTVTGIGMSTSTANQVSLLTLVRKMGSGGAIQNPETFTNGYYENGATGAWSPTPNNGEMWRWGSTTGGQPRGAGVLTYEDFRKTAGSSAGSHPIEHALILAIPARKERMLGPSTRGFCEPGTCWSGNLKGDGAELPGSNVGTPKEELPCYKTPLAEGKCYFPREGTHLRLKESTDCTKNEAKATASTVARAICEALKEYGAVVTDGSNQAQFAAQEYETLGDATAFPNFNPYTAGPKWWEAKGGLTIAKELPVAGNLEVMAATEYCAGTSINPILKTVEGKTQAKAAAALGEGGGSCERKAAAWTEAKSASNE